MRTVDLAHASKEVRELLHQIRSEGEEVTVREGEEVLARIIPLTPRERRPGSARGQVVIHEGFDDPLDDFGPYR